MAVVSFYTESARAGNAPDETYRVLPCRPTVSCTADIVPPGAFEIEVGYLARRAPPRGWVHSEPVLLKLTLVEWLQIQVGGSGHVFTTGEVSRSLRYLDDISFGPKIHFHDQTLFEPSLAVSASLNVPSWDRQSDFPFAYDASFWAYASKDISAFHVDLNGGLNVWQFDIAPSWQEFVTLASSVALPAGLGAMLETYYFTHAGAIAPRDGGLLMAMSWSPRAWLMFDAGGDIGMFPSTRSFSLFAGMTIIPYDFWDTEREAKRRAERNVISRRSYIPTRS